MIKKFLLGIGVGLLTFIGFSYGQAPGITSPTFTILNGSTNTYNGITTSFDPNANFTSDTYLSKALFYNYNTSCPFKSATFRHDGKLYIVSWGGCDNSLRRQGNAYLCKVESLDTKQFCRTYYNEGDPSLTQYYLEQYIDPDYFQFYGYNNPHIGCFVYEDLGEKLCFGVQQDNSNGLDTSLQLFDTAPTGYDDPRFAEFAGDSFWTFGDFPDIVGSGSKALTNGDIILGLSYRYGFSENSCYGGYSLDNLFVPGSDPKDFTGFLMGSGSNIFQIFSSYSGSYFTGIVKFYDSFYSRYQIGNLASFWDYPKGLYSIVERAYLLSQVYNLYPMNMSSLVEYCNLYLNSDWDSLYTGNNIVGQQGYNSLVGEITDNYRYYNTDYLSGQSTGSVSIDEFFESISNRLVGGLEDINDNRTGIIPTYILMVMMALILFRLISH